MSNAGVIQTCLHITRYLRSYISPQIVENRKSKVSGKLEVLYKNGKYMLDTANVNYSFGGLHVIFQKAFTHAGIQHREIKSVLILGFGGGSIASILQNEYGKNVEIVGIEKDEVVIELAKKYFSVEKYKNLSLYCADAYDFVLTTLHAPFDLIVVDTFIDWMVPEKFQEERYLSALNKCLSANGILFYNFIIRDDKSRNKTGQFYKRMENFVGSTEWFKIPDRNTENWIFICDKSKNP